MKMNTTEEQKVAATSYIVKEEVCVPAIEQRHVKTIKSLRSQAHFLFSFLARLAVLATLRSRTLGKFHYLLCFVFIANGIGQMGEAGEDDLCRSCWKHQARQYLHPVFQLKVK